MQATTESPALQFDKLMRVGLRAYENDDQKTAHRAWQYATMVNPNDAEVWRLLLKVVETDEDRLVCLQNMLAINPDNADAKNMLSELTQTNTPAPTEPDDYQLPTIAIDKPVRVQAEPEQQSRPTSSWIMILGFAILTGMLVGIALYWLLFVALQIEF